MQEPQAPPSPLTDARGFKERIRQAMKARTSAGLVPYQGQWLPREEVRKQLHGVRKTSLVRTVELVVLYIVGIVVALLTLQLLWELVY